MPISEAALRLGVSIQTLRAWDTAGTFVPEMRTAGNQRRYSVSQVQEKAGETARAMTVGYCRVSSKKQAADLERQKAVVESACSGFGDYRIISDIGSGINYNKSGLRELLDLMIGGYVTRLVVADKDRLLRFGSELVFSICAIKGIQVVILNSEPDATFEEDLAKDVLEIITVFSARLYGARSKRNKKIIDSLKKSVKRIY